MAYLVLMLIGSALGGGAFLCRIDIGDGKSAKSVIAEVGIVLSIHAFGMLLIAIGVVGTFGPATFGPLFAGYCAICLAASAVHHFATRRRPAL